MGNMTNILQGKEESLGEMDYKGKWKLWKNRSQGGERQATSLRLKEQQELFLSQNTQRTVGGKPGRE